MNGASVVVGGGPYFEELEVGQTFDDAPAVTLTVGHTALYQALFGDRLRLALDARLSREVTGRAEPYVHPGLVGSIVIGQTTGASQRVRGNLFYRGLVFGRPVFVGDTVRTRAEVVGLRQNRPRPGRPATGLVALEVTGENQHGETVMHFWRCPMIPLRDPEGSTGRDDTLDAIEELRLETAVAAVPSEWRVDAFRPHAADLEPGTVLRVEGRDTITGAPEFARLTLNMAAAHHDAAASPYGRRLVYGGHTISMAGAHVVRAVPDLVTIVAWRSCEHTGPVFEGDVVGTTVTVEGIHDLERGGRLLDLRAVVASTAPDSTDGPTRVLDWRFLALTPTAGRRDP